MKIKSLIAGLVILGSCPVPVMALSFPLPWPNAQKVSDGAASALSVSLAVAVIGGLYRTVMAYAFPPSPEEIEQQNRRGIQQRQAVIANNDISLEKYEQQLAKLRQLCVVYKDENLCRQCEDLDKTRIDIILAGAYLKSELAKKMKMEQEKAAREAQMAAMPAKN